MGGIRVTPQDLIDLGKVCSTKAGELGSLVTVLESKVAGTQWESEAATRFKGDWREYKASMDKLRTALDELGTASAKMADNYTRADAAYKTR